MKNGGKCFMENKPTVINGGIAVDDRGSIRFVNDFNFATSGVKRFYQVENHRRGFVRAWHGHLKEAKYVYVVRGSALVAGVKLIPNGQAENFDPEIFILSSKSPKMLYIPRCYANGWMNLEEDTIIQFFSTSTLEESKGDDIRFPYDKWNIWKEDFR